jgi:hypothetical protein
MFRTATKNDRRRTERAVGQAFLNLIVQSCLVAGLAIWIVISVRSGQLAHKGGVIFRGAHPKVFWSIITLLIAFVAFQGLLLLGRLNDYAYCTEHGSMGECAANTLRSLWDAHSASVRLSETDELQS